jgi:type IV pilus assembly protein PilB
MFREFDYEKIPVVDLVNEIIVDAAKKNASDIHFDPSPTVLNVRIRVDGELVDYATVPESVKNALVTRIKIISGMNITESRLPQDGAIKNVIEGKDLDLRVSTLPLVYGEKVVIRILDYTMSSGGLESLGLSKVNLEKVSKLIQTPNGIILITGATGTGKSTTLYSMLQVLNTTSRNIITVEDPVEMKLNGVNQVQTMSEIGLTFASALRSNS